MEIWTLFLSIVLVSSSTNATNSDNTLTAEQLKQMKTCVSGFCLPHNYSTLELPNPKLITNIEMDLEVLDLLKVDDKKFSVSINMYFGIKWNETRLDIRNRISNESFLPLDIRFVNELWVPNIFIYSLVSFTPLVCIKSLAGLWVVEEKELFYNQLSHITFMCPMRFNKFPLDSHTCSFWIGSTNFDETKMTFNLGRLVYEPEGQNPVLDYITEIEELPDNEKTLDYAGSNQRYSITGFRVVLKRHYSKYLFIYYLPSTLFVITSWVSFLIPPEVVPGRMALLVTLFLVLINIFNNVTAITPNTEGMTAISSWMLACIFFLFGALMSYASILYILLQQKLQKQNIKREGLHIIYSKDCKIHPPPEIKQRLEDLDEIERCQRMSSIDAVFLRLFPLSFLVFNLIYWPYWVMMPDESVKP